MGKRNTKLNLVQNQNKAKNRPGAKIKLGTKNQPSGRKTVQAKSQPVKGGARAYNRPPARTAPVNVLWVRIAAAVIAAAALAGGVFWALSVKGAYGAGVIVGLVALGILAGLMIFLAVRTDDVVSRAARMARR